ncbi:MAG TPA: DUF6010 family protein [Vicinamibacteria bacterium]
MSTPTIDSHDPSHSSILARRPILTAVSIGIGSLLPHAFLPHQASIAFAAILISLIAGIYFGFAVVNGSGRHQLVEFNVAGLFAVAGLLGLLYWPVLLPIAYLAHAGWDLAHHNRARLSLVAIPRWYVPWCAVIDAIIGAGLLVIWRSTGIL